MVFRVALLEETGSDQNQKILVENRRSVSRDATAILRNREPQGPPRSQSKVVFSHGASRRCFRMALLEETGTDPKHNFIPQQKRSVSRDASVVLRNRETSRTKTIIRT